MKIISMIVAMLVIAFPPLAVSQDSKSSKVSNTASSQNVSAPTKVAYVTNEAEVARMTCPERIRHFSKVAELRGMKKGSEAGRWVIEQTMKFGRCA